MHSVRWIVVTSVAAALVGCATQQKPAASTAASTTVKPVASTKPAPAKPGATAAVKPVPKTPPAPRVSEFQQVLDVLNLQGADLAKYKAAWDAREKAVADFGKSADGQELAALRTELAAAKQAKDEAKIKALETQLAPLARKEGDLRLAQRANVFGTLTLAQQQQWAAYQLNNWAVTRAVRRVKYTDAQLKQIRSICDKAVAGFVKADTLAKDPYLATLKELYPQVTTQITDTVLTAEQKAAQQQAAPAAKK